MRLPHKFVYSYSGKCTITIRLHVYVIHNDCRVDLNSDIYRVRQVESEFLTVEVLRFMVNESGKAKSLVQLTISEFLCVIDVRTIWRCTGFISRELPLVLL
jgi:hypothetical protein